MLHSACLLQFVCTKCVCVCIVCVAMYLLVSGFGVFRRCFRLCPLHSCICIRVHNKFEFHCAPLCVLLSVSVSCNTGLQCVCVMTVTSCSLEIQVQGCPVCEYLRAIVCVRDKCEARCYLDIQTQLYRV